MRYEIEVAGRVRQVVVHRTGGRFSVSVDGRDEPVDAVRVDAYTWSLLIDGRSFDVTMSPGGGPGLFTVGVGATPVAASLNGRRRWGRKDDGRAPGGTQRVIAPMPGRIARVLVKPGDAVRLRQPLIVIEAMKMENELSAAGDGRVSEVQAREGQSVDAGALLVLIAGSD